MSWYAVYTKPKAEDATAAHLEMAGIRTINPKIKVKKYLRKKYKEVIEPLFPCYVFASFDLRDQVHLVKYTRGVRYIVGKDSPMAVHDLIIEAILERMEEGDIVRPLRDSFERGDRVLIKEGLFKDFYGVFERDIPGRERVMILLETIQSKIEIEGHSIRKAV